MSHIHLKILAILLFAAAGLRLGAIPSPESSLKGKNVVILGDSNTWLGGDDCSDPRGWTYEWVRETTPRWCRSYARSGATWTNTPATRLNTRENISVLGDDNTIYNQIMRLKEDLDSMKVPRPDLVIIAAGTNDIWFASKRPSLLDVNAESAMVIPDGDILACEPGEVVTLAESLRYGCEIIENMLPSAKVVVFTPMQFTKANPQRFEAVTTLMERICEMMEIDVVRQDKELEINAASEHKALKLTRDGVHTNREGAARNGRYLARRICALYDRKSGD